MRFNIMILIESAKQMVDNPIIHILVWSVITDIVSGFSKAFVLKSKAQKGNSTKGLQGLIKHLLVIVTIFIAYPYMDVLGFKTEANLIVGFYIATYAISITENWGQMGLPVPTWLRSRLDKLKDDTDKGIEKDDEV